MLTKVLTKNKTTVQVNTKCEDDIWNRDNEFVVSWYCRCNCFNIYIKSEIQKIGAFFKEKYIFAKWNSYKCQFNLDSNSIQPFKLIH